MPNPSYPNFSDTIGHPAHTRLTRAVRALCRDHSFGWVLMALIEYCMARERGALIAGHAGAANKWVNVGYALEMVLKSL